jgi:diguanylate cyclase (GGDEF)-like protein
LPSTSRSLRRSVCRPSPQDAGSPVSQTEATAPSEHSRSLVREVLGVQLAITAIGGLIAVAGLAWTSGAVVRDNLEHWATQWASELNELGAPFYLNDAGAAMLDVERFIAKYPEIARVTWYDTSGGVLLSLGGDGTTFIDAAPLDAATATELGARAGLYPPYLLTQNVSPGQRYRLSGPIWTESFADDALFSDDPAAAATSVNRLGFVSVDLDFSGYEDALWPRLATASGILLVLLGISWACGRWFLKSALTPLSELEHSLAQLASEAQTVRFPTSPYTELRAIVVALEDTTRALQKRERRLLHLANHDQLTGLANRHRFVAELDAELTRCADSGARSALFFVDLDQFKYVNDTCGHPAGDHLLQLAAQQLRYAVRPEDFVARFGGDEFVILVRDVSRNDARAAATKVLELMRGLKHVEREQVFHLQCSIGVALLHGNRVTSHEVIAQADIACRSAKAHGRNRVEIYSAAGKQSEQIADDVATMNRLRSALETDRFELLYQPLMHITTRTISHYETLLRLPTETGVLRPESFLPAAFRFGLMADIDRWVLKRVVQSLAELTPSMPGIKLSTNLSGFAFEDEGLAAYLRGVLKDHGISGDRLVLEITEQLAVRFAASTDKQITMLRDLGCQLAIDDFGSGYSSFGYLKRLPVDFLKIDGAFIKSLPRDRVDQAMVRMVGEVARAAGIQTVAEYVNSAATFDLLAKYGIDYAQGYYIGKPMAQPMPSNVTRIDRHATRAG